METIFNKKNFKTIFIIIVIDIVIIGGWTWYIKPEDSISIILAFVIPLIFLANLVIGSITYFIKKYYTPFFMINAFVSSFMLYYFFVWYIEMEAKKFYNEWEFVINNEKYDISYITKDTVYFVYINCGKGCSNGYDRGIVKEKMIRCIFCR